MSLKDVISDENKQRIAAEVNQPITAFVARHWTRGTDGSDSALKIQYFTPTQEFPICGHATIASVLLMKTLNDNINDVKNVQKYCFENRFGEELKTTVDEDNWITISMPIISQMKSIRLDDKWTEDIVAITLGHRMAISDVTEVSFDDKFIIIRLKDCDENLVMKVTPDFDQMNRIQERKGAKIGIIVTQKTNKSVEKVDFYSRVFAPWIGINEDPVCGTAHSQLMPFWSQRLPFNGQTLIGKQCSQRSGIVQCRMNGDRVELSGRAVIVMKGKYFL